MSSVQAAGLFGILFKKRAPKSKSLMMVPCRFQVWAGILYNMPKRSLKHITREAEVNKVYKGLVKRVVDFGAFVELFPGTEGLCHVSELADKRIERVTDVLQEGDEVNVVVLSIDREGKIRLSKKESYGQKPRRVYLIM